MNQQETFFLVIVLIALSSLGWGRLVVWALTRTRSLARAPVRLDPALEVAIGISAFLAVGGIFVAADSARFWFLLAWLITGAVVAIGFIVAEQTYRSWTGLFRWRFAPAWAGVGACAFLAFGPALCGAWNLYDDAPAYSFLGQRLLATGGLIDPFNTRRLNSYGGAELFQAIIIKTVGVIAGIGIEWYLFLLLVVALLVRSVRRPRSWIVVWIVALGVVVMRPVGEWANTAPSFSGVALTLALARVLSEHRDERDGWWRWIVAGLLFASLFALRLEFVAGGGLVIIACAMRDWSPSRTVGRLATTAAAAVAALSGWAVALDRSSGTPLFPVIKGNWTQQSWFLDPAIHTVAQHVANIWRIAQTDDFSLGIAFAIVASVVGVLAGRSPNVRLHVMQHSDGSSAGGDRIDLVTVGALALGAILLAISQSYVNSGSTYADIGRYSGPAVLACVLFALDQLGGSVIRLTGGSVPGDPANKSRLTAGAIAVVGLGGFLCFLGPHPSAWWANTDIAYRQAYRAASGEPVLKTAWNATYIASQAPTYREMNARIPRGTYLLAAVNLPGELDLARFQIATLDEPGGSSPPPHLDLTGGPTRAVAYLRSLGIDGIVAATGADDGLYNTAAAQSQLYAGVPYYRIGSRTTIEWQNLLVAIEHRYKTLRIRHLRYLSFDRPRR